jgi:hypothetical protein
MSIMCNEFLEKFPGLLDFPWKRNWYCVGSEDATPSKVDRTATGGYVSATIVEP